MPGTGCCLHYSLLEDGHRKVLTGSGHLLDIMVLLWPDMFELLLLAATGCLHHCLHNFVRIFVILTE